MLVTLQVQKFGKTKNVRGRFLMKLIGVLEQITRLVIDLVIATSRYPLILFYALRRVITCSYISHDIAVYANM